jgi:hypothetical protein
MPETPIDSLSKTDTRIFPAGVPLAVPPLLWYSLCSDWAMAFSGFSPYHAVTVTISKFSPPCRTKMFSRLSAAAFRNAASTGVARSSSIFHGARSGAVLCLSTEFFWAFNSPGGPRFRSVLRPQRVLHRALLRCILIWLSFRNYILSSTVVPHELSCYTCVCLPFRSWHNCLVYPSLWHASVCWRSARKPSQ